MLLQPAEYDPSDTERFVLESDTKVGARSPFARDRARVLHCSALRRLAGKTQVVMTGVSDIPRTRLTHSLEVAQVARELGGELGCDPDLVDVAALSHDLGHPPFGHNGETVLDELATECGGFEGNAQTFRILTRLEAKVRSDDRSVGLNLTRATLDGCLKYPWFSTGPASKYGVYAEDAELFDWVRSSTVPRARCLEAQVMDWADDVAYSVHDLDDAIQLRLFDPAWLDSPAERNAVVSRCIEWYLPRADPGELLAALERIRALPQWRGGFDGSMRGLALVKELTSVLIGRFCTSAYRSTREVWGERPLRRYAAALEVPDDIRAEVAVLKAVSAHYVMSRPGTDPQYEAQADMIRTVFHHLRATGEELLEPWLRPAWALVDDDSARTRLIVDQIASLTDRGLRDWAEAATGKSWLSV